MHPEQQDLHFHKKITEAESKFCDILRWLINPGEQFPQCEIDQKCSPSGYVMFMPALRDMLPGWQAHN